ncbi:hypothetical protein CDCA_CDCA06G1935 [Cyanidium caldarium]|uniref:Fungal lipase-type domain-containing protein n=1 Tax=Cyanidium caldarium TaxID=2771 RepID=A0AAV9IUD8_CYACA|nr:hypothetical protein CDCA_CDCA06G1935 [Cyanidium caldarium]
MVSSGAGGAPTRHRSEGDAFPAATKKRSQVGSAVRWLFRPLGVVVRAVDSKVDALTAMVSMYKAELAATSAARISDTHPSTFVGAAAQHPMSADRASAEAPKEIHRGPLAAPPAALSMDDDAEAVTSRPSKDADPLLRHDSSSLAWALLWTESARRLPSKARKHMRVRTVMPLEKFEVFRSSQMNLVLVLLWFFAALELATTTTIAVEARAAGSAIYLWQGAFTIAAGVVGVLEFAIALLLHLYYTARLFARPAAQRTRVQYTVAASTWCFLWMFQPVLWIQKLANPRRTRLVMPDLAYYFDAAASVAYYWGVYGSLWMLGHLFRFRDTQRIPWWRVVTPKLCLIGSLSAMYIVFSAVCRASPSRIAFATLVSVIRINRATTIDNAEVWVCTALLTLFELLVIVFIVYELRRTRRHLFRENYVTSRRRQLGFRIFLYVMVLSVVVVTVNSLLLSILLPNNIASVLYVLNRLHAAGAESAYNFGNAVYFIGGVAFEPIYTSNYIFVQNGMLLAAIVTMVLLFLPPLTPRVLQRLLCCLATREEDFELTFMRYCCTEPAPLYILMPRDREVAHRSTATAAETESPMAFLHPLQGLGTGVLHPRQVIDRLLQPLSGLATVPPPPPPPVQQPEPVDELRRIPRTLDAQVTTHAAAPGEVNLRVYQADYIPPEQVPRLRRYVFCVDTMVQQLNLAGATYAFHPGEPFPCHIADARLTVSAVTMLYDADSDTFGLVASAADRIVVAFRGTRSRKNLRADLRATMVPMRFDDDALDAEIAASVRDYQEWRAQHTVNRVIGLVSAGAQSVQQWRLPGGGPRVHAGFFQMYRRVYKRLELQVMQLVMESPRPIFLTGHSLGGALANLAALHLAARLRLGRTSLLLTTFGAPKAGDAAFAQLLDFLVPVHFRVTNSGDFVPRLPVARLGCGCLYNRLPYAHAGVQVLLNRHGTMVIDPSLIEVRWKYGISTSVEPHKRSTYRANIEEWARRLGTSWRPQFWELPPQNGRSAPATAETLYEQVEAERENLQRVRVTSEESAPSSDSAV